MEPDDDPIQLSEEVLNLMEMHDIVEAQQLSLSLNAMAGSHSTNCLRLRALVGNQVMLILVDSGSSSSYLPVKVANGQYMYTNKMVPALSWW